MNKTNKLALIERSLALRHKLRVHDSMKAPDNHEEMALTLLSKWDLEDELHSIEEVLAEQRKAVVQSKKIALLKTTELKPEPKEEPKAFLVPNPTSAGAIPEGLTNRYRERGALRPPAAEEENLQQKPELNPFQDPHSLKA